MQDRRVRVVLGSDGDQARDVLSGLVERQSGVVVGQARNAPEALSLARNLRPDVVILDFHLPHTRALASVSLSRAAGLDTAQLITDEIPAARVLVVNNLDTFSPLQATPGAAISLYHDNGGNSKTAPLELGNLPVSTTSPMFTRISAAKPSIRARLAEAAEQVMLFGIVGILLGLMMMITGLLFMPGILAVLLGGVAALLGFGTRLALRYVFGRSTQDLT